MNVSSCVYWIFCCMVVKFYLTSLIKTPWQYIYLVYQHQNSVGGFLFSPSEIQLQPVTNAWIRISRTNFSLFFFFGPFWRSARTERTDNGQRISEYWRLKLSELWRFVVGRVDPDVSKERNPSFFSVRRSFWIAWPWRWRHDDHSKRWQPFAPRYIITSQKKPCFL